MPTRSIAMRMVDGLTAQHQDRGVGRDKFYEFSYRDTDPERARRVVQDLVSMFLERTSATSSVIRRCARIHRRAGQAIRGRLAEAERRLKEFKLRNMGTPSGQARTTSLASRALRRR